MVLFFQKTSSASESTRQETVRVVGGGVAIQVLAKPGAKENNITGKYCSKFYQVTRNLLVTLIYQESDSV